MYLKNGFNIGVQPHIRPVLISTTLQRVSNDNLGEDRRILTLGEMSLRPAMLYHEREGFGPEERIVE